jgi:hypothetical protein
MSSMTFRVVSVMVDLGYINRGQLRAVKRGRRTLVLAADLEAFVASWPAAAIKSAKAAAE